MIAQSAAQKDGLAATRAQDSSSSRQGLMKAVTKWAKSQLMNLGRDAIRHFEGKWVNKGGRIPFPRAEM